MYVGWFYIHRSVNPLNCYWDVDGLWACDPFQSEIMIRSTVWLIGLLRSRSSTGKIHTAGMSWNEDRFLFEMKSNTPPPNPYNVNVSSVLYFLFLLNFASFSGIFLSSVCDFHSSQNVHSQHTHGQQWDIVLPQVHVLSRKHYGGRLLHQQP